MDNLISVDIKHNISPDPFGMITVGRSWDVGGGYRYGFNGMENDDETYGNANAVDFGARIYDARLGRWMSVDHQFKRMPDISPYVFVLNTPLIAIDPDGNFTFFVGGAIYKDKPEKNNPKTFSANFIKTMGSILGKEHFQVVKSAAVGMKEATPWAISNGYKPSLDVCNDEILANALDEVETAYNNALIANPEEPLNLVGSSYGSVMVAQMAIALTEGGYKVNSVVMTGSPVDQDSELYKKLLELNIDVVYIPNEEDAVTGIIGDEKGDFKKNITNELKGKRQGNFGSHIKAMFNLNRVNIIIQKTIIAKETEGSENAQKANEVLNQRTQND